MENTELKKQALEFLNEPNRLTAVIGSCPKDGDTHVATVYYYVDHNFNFFFLTGVHTQKYRNLIDNPNAAIAIGFGPSYTTIQGRGEAFLLEKNSEEEKQAIANIKHRLQNHNNETWPLFQLEAFETETIAVFKLVPETLQLLNLEDTCGLTATRKDILQIL